MKSAEASEVCVSLSWRLAAARRRRKRRKKRKKKMKEGKKEKRKNETLQRNACELVARSVLGKKEEFLGRHSGGEMRLFLSSSSSSSFSKVCSRITKKNEGT
jgi:hypothetical protein